MVTTLSPPRIGSLCSGYGGLELGLQAVVGGTVAWHAEYDDAPAAVLAHHWPQVPNLRDITTIDWTAVEPVDWLTAGWPCQPFSLAGKRKGSDDERHLWPYVAAAVGALRPRWFLGENVAGHVTLGLGAVLGDLAALGYDATWGVVRAADAGAPHRRERLFIVACDTDGMARPATLGRRGQRSTMGGPGTVTGTLGPDRVPVPDADGEHERAISAGDRRGQSEAPARDGRSRAVPDPPCDRRDERRAEPARLLGGPDASLGGHAAADAECDAVREQPVALAGRSGAALARVPGADAWGPYGPAITRWEHVTGRSAPRPTEHGPNGRGRLSPAFVEWLMGLPAGHVTAVPRLTRNAQLKALGNGVFPQQAALAVRTLLPLLESECAA